MNDQERAANPLQQAALQTAPLNPIHWSLANRLMPDGGQYQILRNGYWYLYEPMATLAKLPRAGKLAVMKCAQSGWTEAAISAAFWFMQHKQEGVLYMLPGQDQLGQFAQARVDLAIKSSPRIAAAFSEISNVGLKIGWGQTLYLRGAHSPEKLREIPIGFLIRDEFQVMDEEGREQATSRLGASKYKWVYDLANPQFPETGIHSEYLYGDQRVWEILCPTCKAWAEPRWPESVKEVGGRYRLVCYNCGGAIRPTPLTPGELPNFRWKAENPGAPFPSFRMSQLISPRVEPAELIRQWEYAKGDATKEGVFWNFCLGLPYAPEGSGITDEILSRLPSLGEMVAGYNRPTVMGVDVGSLLHVEVRRVEGGILWAGVTDWVNLARMMGAYSVRAVGIDAMPETTKAKEFARRFPGKVKLVRYLPPVSRGRQESLEDGVQVISVPRTEAIDEAFARIFSGEEAMPSNAPRRFSEHFRALKRQFVKSPSGETYASWVETGPDHFAHAFVYSELVRPKGSEKEQVQVF